MSNADWYAKKLAPAQPAPARPDPTPARFTPMPGTPVTRAPYAEPPVPHPASPQHQAAQRFDNDAWASMDSEQRRLYLLNNPKEGAGAKDAQRCPECGSGNLYSRRNTGGLRGSGVFPAPQCYDCGWPLVQSGSIGGALSVGGGE